MSGEAEDALIEEIENSLREDGGLGFDTASGEDPEPLPASPFRFVLYYLKFYKWPLLAIALFELGQATCQILIPKAVQRLIDSASLITAGPDTSVWALLVDPMKYFVLLNIGILAFSRASGS